jgi:DNA-3-methyladenine glycosylase
MFGPPGVAYVYLVYGMYDCLNVVTEPDGRAGAVLIRAAEAVAGQAAMRAALAGHRARRNGGDGGDGGDGEGPPARVIPGDRLAAGPGLVAAALSVDRSVSGLDLCEPSSPLRLELPRAPGRVARPVAAPRIGVAYAAEPWASAPYRLLDPTSRALSGRAPPTVVPPLAGARLTGR